MAFCHKPTCDATQPRMSICGGCLHEKRDFSAKNVFIDKTIEMNLLTSIESLRKVRFITDQETFVSHLFYVNRIHYLREAYAVNETSA